MAKGFPWRQESGFSLVELLVALVFTMILMAGMAVVFKTSLSTVYASGEKLSSVRRNRMSLDMLEDDLNNAGMFLTDLSTPPSVSSTNPSFYFLPNPSSVPNVTQGADELYFYMDEPLPFEGSLSSTTARTASQLVQSGDPVVPSDFTYTVECNDATYANKVQAGQFFIFKDSWEGFSIQQIDSVSGSRVTVVAGADVSAAALGRGFSGAPSKFSHIKPSGLNAGTSIVFVKPAQMVRYSIQNLSLDPTSGTAATPCLVRDQGAYASSGFTASEPQEIIAENVTGFRVYVSADSGKNWIGGAGYADWAAVKLALDTQLGTVGRTGYTSTGLDPNWFRSIPVLIRVDVTTRTATQRSDYSSTGSSLAYKEQTQSLVMVPRHFGLSLN